MVDESMKRRDGEQFGKGGKEQNEGVSPPAPYVTRFY